MNMKTKVPVIIYYLPDVTQVNDKYGSNCMEQCLRKNPVMQPFDRDFFFFFFFFFFLQLGFIQVKLCNRAFRYACWHSGPLEVFQFDKL